MATTRRTTPDSAERRAQPPKPTSRRPAGRERPGETGPGTLPRSGSPFTRAQRPGLQPDESFVDYDAWFKSPQADWVPSVIEVVPEFTDTIRSIAWTYRNADGSAIADQLQQAGIWDLFLSRNGGGGGGGGRYGGGGGGVSKDQQYAQAEASIRNQVRSLGVPFNDDQIRSIAKVAVDNNWSADMVTDYVVAGSGDWGTLQEGQLTASVEQLRALAQSQLISLSDDSLRDYARRMASGEMTQDTVRMLFANQAKSTFSWLAPQIDAGLTVRDVLLPSRDLMAQELEVPAETIDLMDAKWQAMTMTRENGTLRAATNDEVIRNVRQTGEWAKTQNARNLTTAAMMRLRSMFTGG